MRLAHDPAQGEAFWAGVRALPGYPHRDEIRLKVMRFEPGALFQLPRTMHAAGAEPGSPLRVVMDPTVMHRGDDDLKPLVLSLLRQHGWTTEDVVVRPDSSGQVHTDLAQIGTVKKRLAAGVAVVALGSGTVTDIAKHACHVFEQESGTRVPFVVVQTANSVSAYTSNMAPTFVEGVKRTLPSRYPDALICDPETLRDAPTPMTAAGVGDLLAGLVSFADWYLAYRFGMDTGYTRLPEALMGPLESLLTELAPGVQRRDLEAAGVLAKLIALAGLAMSLAHATSPLSGFEHVISHVVDLLAEAKGRPLAAHGAQVALAAGLSAGSYQRLLARFDPASLDPGRCFSDADAMKAIVLGAFAGIDPSGRVGAECWADYRIKLDAWTARRGDFRQTLADWPDIRIGLQERAVPLQRLAAIAGAVGLPASFQQLDPPVAEDQARFAFLNAPFIRRRFTIGDLLVFLGWDRPALWDEIKPGSV